MSKTALPEYKKPPVSEVGLSVTFTSLEKWRSAHAGIYWSKVTSRYPLTEVHPPLPSQVETFGEEPKPIKSMVFRLDLPSPDSQRYWFMSDPPSRLVQVQRDRFAVNWRQVQGDEEYPRYAGDLRGRFAQEWTAFVEFLKEHNLGEPEVLQCEVFYTNDILRNVSWKEFKESLSFFAPWWGKGSEGFLPLPETLQVSGSFAMPEKSGRLHFAMQRVLRSIDSNEAIQLQLIARGKPQSTRLDDILAWMDLGREWIVRGFTDLTSPAAHKTWERTQ